MADYAMDNAGFWLERYVNAYVSTMLNSIPVSREFQDLIAFLLMRIEVMVHAQQLAEAPAPESAGFEEWLDREIAYQDEWGKAPALGEMLGEISNCFTVYREYVEKAREAREALTADYRLVMGQGKLGDVLGEGVSSEDFYLDEYQIELLRAKTLEEYWERRVMIAGAVYDYARDLSSGRLTDGEGAAAWEGARTAYEDAVGAYDEILLRLDQSGETMALTRMEIDAAAAAVRDAEEALERLSQDYEAVQTMRESGGINVAEGDLEGLYRELLDLVGLLNRGGREGAYYALVEAAMALDTADEIENRAGYLQALITGEAMEDNLLEEWETIEEDPEEDEGDGTGGEMAVSLRQLYEGAKAASEWKAAKEAEEEEAWETAAEAEAAAAAAAEAAKEAAEAAALEAREAAEAAAAAAQEARAAWAAAEALLSERLDLLRSLLADTEGEGAAFAVRFNSLLENRQKNTLDAAIAYIKTLDEEMAGAPRWLKEEYENWKWSYLGGYMGQLITQGRQAPFAEDAPALTLFYREIEALFEEGGTEAERHWRLYVEERAAPGFEGAKTWEEAFLLDLRVGEERNRLRLLDALEVYSNQDPAAVYGGLQGIMQKYLDAPETSWEDEGFGAVDPRLGTKYDNEKIKLDQYLYTEYSLKADFAEMAKLLKLSKLEDAALAGEVEELLRGIKLRQEIYDQLSEAYLSASQKLIDQGHEYDLVYGETKKLYGELEQARFEYEKQDAIRRWASTAYLEAADEPEGLLVPCRSPGEDLAYSREQKDRASAALDVLKTLYEHETRRPYENQAYEALHHRYEENYGDLLLAVKVQYDLAGKIAEEREINYNAYNAYRKQVDKLAVVPGIDPSYRSPEDTSKWTILDLVTVKDGKLRFAGNGALPVTGLDEAGAAALDDYFNGLSIQGDEQFESSPFELAARDLFKRLASYQFSSEGYKTFAYARDYMIGSLIKVNPGLKYLEDQISHAKVLQPGEVLGNYKVNPKTKLSKVVKNKKSAVEAAQKKAWKSLSAQEQEDLEFYTILCLMGGGGEGAAYFGRMNEYAELEVAVKITQTIVNDMNSFPDKLFSWIGGAKDEARYMARSASVLFNELDQQLTDAAHNLSGGLDSLTAVLAKYEASNQRLASLTGNKENGTITWQEIYESLTLAEILTAEELSNLERFWNTMKAETERTFTDVQSGIGALVQWGVLRKEKNLKNLEDLYQAQEEDRLLAENQYREVYESFMRGEASAAELGAAVTAAFDKNSPAKKTHLDHLGAPLNTHLDKALEGRSFAAAQAGLVGADYVDLLTLLYQNRYGEELRAREMEWAVQANEIREKYAAWRNTADLILERGRADWKAGLEHLNEAYSRWYASFRTEYQHTYDEWNAACLEGLMEKEEWIAQAAAAAEEGASGAVLALVGADGEAKARSMDTRDFRSLSGFEDPDAAGALESLLQGSSIANLFSAFEGLNGLGKTLQVTVRRGFGGPSSLNGSVMLAEAALLARETNSIIAEQETKKLAYNVRETALAAMEALKERVGEVNKSFRANMDELFIMEAQFNRSGGDYKKDVLVHSTLFKNVITEKAFIEGYLNYALPSLQLAADLSEGALRNLDSLAVQELMGRVYDEIGDIQERIFGDEESIEQSKNGIAGEFGVHLGTAPELKDDFNIDKAKEKIFKDPGSGENGRLLGDFYYWRIKEQKGIAYLNMPGYRKPMWDDRNSWFNAPSLKDVVDIGIQVGTMIAGIAGSPFTGGTSFIGAVAAGAAINTADDLVFSVMDVASGYASFGEAAFNLGKSFTLNMVGSAMGSAFNGVQGASSAFLNGGGLTGLAAGQVSSKAGQIFTKTAMAGLQSLGTSTLTSTLGAVSYDRKNGWGYSGEYLIEGLKGGLRNSLVAMTGASVTNIMNTGLTGFLDNLYKDGRVLSGMTGSLAGQGVNFALGNDFTLNLANLGFLARGGGVNAGILEMHLGRDGMSMNFGTGGADISAGTLINSFKGLESWKVNLELALSRETETKTYTEALRTLYSNEGENRQEYEKILAGKTNVLTWDLRETQSFSTASQGQKIVFLGTEALNDAYPLSLGVVLSHESYRDGRDNGDEAQLAERDRAVMGHMNTASSILTAYGRGSLGEQMEFEAFLYGTALRSGDSSLMEPMFELYDTSGDYWKLISRADGTHSVVWDDSKELTISYLNEKGETINTVKPEGQRLDNVGVAGSLAYVVGLSRAEQLLNASLEDPGTYSDQTLREVLDLSEAEIAAIRQSGSLPASVTEAQKLSLAGEALLYSLGVTWDGKSWAGIDLVNTTLTDRNLKNWGYILGAAGESGQLEYSTIHAFVARNTGTYQGWSSLEGARANLKKQALDIMSYYQFSLEGELLSLTEIKQVHTVDNMTTNSKAQDLNQPYYSKRYGNIQGNTIAPGTFNMEYYGQSNYIGKVDGLDNAVLVINNAKTIGGYTVNNTGHGGDSSLRWLFHSNSNYDTREDYNSYYSDGCFVVSTAAMNSMLSFLASTGMQRGYQIRTTLEEYTW
jgi:hypothetical protein